jgi:hypothetical protein
MFGQDDHLSVVDLASPKDAAHENREDIGSPSAHHPAFFAEWKVTPASAGIQTAKADHHLPIGIFHSQQEAAMASVARLSSSPARSPLASAVEDEVPHAVSPKTAIPGRIPSPGPLGRAISR